MQQAIVGISLDSTVRLSSQWYIYSIELLTDHRPNSAIQVINRCSVAIVIGLILPTE